MVECGSLPVARLYLAKGGGWDRVVSLEIKETFKFNDEKDWEYEIWLKGFSRILKQQTLRKLHCTFESKEKLSLLFLLKEVKPSTDRKMINFQTFDNLAATMTFSLKKLVVEWRRLSRFPAKLTLPHWQGLLSVEKILNSSENPKVSKNKKTVRSGKIQLLKPSFIAF